MFNKFYKVSLSSLTFLVVTSWVFADDQPARKLPTPPPISTSQAGESATAKPESETNAEEPQERLTAEEAVQGAYLAPPDAKALSRENHLWVDVNKKRVYVDGFVILNRGQLEMFACPTQSKEHESLVATLARPSQVHAALLAVGAIQGTPVRYEPSFLPATGQRIRVWVAWLDEQGKYHVTDARKWVQKAGTEESLTTDWVFVGSGFWKDDDGREYYKADAGDMICVSNFSTAMLDLPVESSSQADQLNYSAFTDRIPKRGTIVRLILVPLPVPSDKPDEAKSVDAETPPTVEILTKKPTPAEER